jgi:DNA (cytosine-5)-methyltransferase 1
MRHGSLFSGIGGFDLASQWMGWENVFHCEWMEFPRKVLHHYWPKAISYDDITRTDFSIHRGGIDILTGGFPCQPYSAAGKRKGKDDDRHLWPHMLRAIREIRPRWVVAENVFGLINWNGGVVLEEVCADLEAEGYAVQPFIIPACAVGAPHRRDRIWIVANATRTNDRGTFGNIRGTYEETQRSCITKPAHPNVEGIASNTDNTGDSALRGGTDGNWTQSSEQRQQSFSELSRPCDTGIASDTDLHGRNECNGNDEVYAGQGWQYAQRDIEQADIQDYWHNFPTVTPICGGDDGIPAELDGITLPKWRRESIKGYGNAIVPQVAFQIFKAIEHYEHTNSD